MSRTPILLAVALALTPAGAAAAESLHYQVYGLAHVSTDLQNNGEDSSLFVSSNTSRFGIRGRYATDCAALTVVFQYENGADFNGERASLTSRNSFAGLMGDWGRLIWGRHDTPVYTLGRMVDFFDGRVGDLRNATGEFGGGWDRRPASMIMYSTPLLGDALKLHAQYVPEEGVDDSSLLSASGVYEQGGLMIGLGYEHHGKALEPAHTDSTDGESSGGIRAVASYQSGGLRLAGLYQALSNVGGFDGVSATTYGLGASYRVDGRWEPKAQYYLIDPNTDQDDDGTSMVVVGLDYHLNQRARLYLTYAVMLNEDGGRWVPFLGGHGKSYGYGAEQPGESPYGLSVGLVANW